MFLKLYFYERVFMKSIKFYAQVVKMASYALMLSLIAGFFFKWLAQEIALDYGNHHFLFFALDNSFKALIAGMPFLHRVLGMIIDSFSFGLLFFIFLLVARLMNYFQQGEIFTAATVMLISLIGKTTFYLALYTPINRIILSLVISLHNPPGQRFISASFEPSDVFNILAFGFFMVITLLMREGNFLQEEKNLTV